MNKKHGGGVFKKMSRVLTYMIAVLLLCISAVVVLDHFGVVEWADWLTEGGRGEVEKIDIGDGPADGSVAVVSSPDAMPVSWTGVQEALISGSDVSLMSEPDGLSQVLCGMKNGEKATIIGRQGNWYRLRRSCYTGWAQVSGVRPTGALKEYSAESLEAERASHKADAEAAASTAEKKDIAKELDAIASKYSAVGAQAAVIKNGEVVYVHSYGYANRKERKPMNDDTKIRSASVSKVGVAMAAMVMAEQGIIDLDADISQYLGVEVRNPAYRNIPLTMRMLLRHDSTLIADISRRESYDSFMEKLNDPGAYRKGCKPGNGSSWAYSNSGLCLAGMTLEAASGVVLVDFIDDYFFAPMGVDASYHASHIKDRDNIADLYDAGMVLSQTVAEQLERPYSEKPGTNFRLYAGDLTISAQDLARLICVLADDGTYDGMYYMSPETVEEMQKDEIKQENFMQCLTIRKKENFLGGRTWYYHTGNAYGTRAFLAYDDKTRDGIVIITTGADEGLTKGVYTVCYKMAECLEAELLS